MIKNDGYLYYNHSQSIQMKINPNIFKSRTSFLITLNQQFLIYKSHVALIIHVKGIRVCNLSMFSIIYSKTPQYHASRGKQMARYSGGGGGGGGGAVF